jgi:hypothetical protein
MHHDTSWDAPPISFIKPHAKDKHVGQPRPCFEGISWRRVSQGSMEVTQSKINQVEGTIMQAKEWTITFGRCNPVEHAVTKQQSKHERVGEEPSQVGKSPI